jgi:hypothetical protein
MDHPHKRVVTTHGVAIKAGQGRVHIPEQARHPWHRKSEHITCPICGTGYTLYTVSGEFPKPVLDGILIDHHKNKQGHPDFITSMPEFWRLEDCDCERVGAPS